MSGVEWFLLGFLAGGIFAFCLTALMVASSRYSRKCEEKYGESEIDGSGRGGV